MGSYLWSWQRAQPRVMPQEDRTGGPHHVIEDIPAPLGPSVPLHRNPLVEEPGPQLGLVPEVAVGVAGDLFLDEPIVGSILVESPDHVVPVSPQVGAGIVGRLSPRCRRSAPGRASAGPSGRRIRNARAGSRSPCDRPLRTDPRESVGLPPEWAAGRSVRNRCAAGEPARRRRAPGPFPFLPAWPG